MKLHVLFAVILTCGISPKLYSQANQSLSNLTSPTSVNQALSPNANGIFDFGTGPLNWRNLYLNGSIFRNTTRIFTAGGNNVAIGAGALNTNNGISNIAIGNNALFSVTSTALNNVGLGYNALYTNSTGASNVAIGSSALYSNTAGFANIALGHGALQQNTTGQRNVGIGFESLKNNTNASFNTAVGYIALRDNTTGRGNTAIGYAAMLLNTTGRHNTALGDSALFRNNGQRNTANGAFSLWQNTTGNDNTTQGANSLAANTTGFSNVSMGSSALLTNTTGSLNTALGFESMRNNTTAYHNTAIGNSTLRSNTTGYFNVAIGSNAATLNTTGHSNVAIGGNAMQQNINGYSSVSIGKDALREDKVPQNTVAIGDSALLYNQSIGGGINGKYNTAVGSKAGINNVDGSLNTAIGYIALSNQSSASGSTAVGARALDDLRDGNWNTAVGNDAGVNLSSGNSNTFLGHSSGTTVSNVNNSTAIGDFSAVTANNQVRVGFEFTTSIGGSVDWTTLSDGRFKRQVKENVPGLSFINKLKTVTYAIDTKELTHFLHSGQMEEFKKAGVDFDVMAEQSGKGKSIYSGFIAQEVEQAAKSIGYEFSGVDAPKNENDYYGLRYGQFVVPLVKAVQELSKQNEDLKAIVAAQQLQINEILQKFDNNQSAQTSAGSSQTAILKTSDGASLQQNKPNPYNNATVVNFSLPGHYTSAMIVVTDMYGKTIQRTNVAGSTSLRIAAGSLASGSYNYSLIVDGNIISTKTMVIAK